MKLKAFIISLTLLALPACQSDKTTEQQDVQSLDSEDLTRLANEHRSATAKGERSSSDTFIPPGTPVAMTGVCLIARDVPVFGIDLPNQPAHDQEDWPEGFRAHLEDNPEVSKMKKGQRYLVEGRIKGDETMCYNAYFIAVDSFTPID